MRVSSKSHDTAWYKYNITSYNVFSHEKLKLLFINFNLCVYVIVNNIFWVELSKFTRVFFENKILKIKFLNIFSILKSLCYFSIICL